MKKSLITILMVGIFLPAFGQTTKKKGSKKPVRKAVVKKPIAKNETTVAKIDSSLIVKKEPEAQKVVEVQKVEETTENTGDLKLAQVGDIILKKSGYIKNRNSVYYKGIIGMMKGIYTNDNKVFVLLEIKNTSNLDYDIESVFFNTSPVKKRRENLELEEKNFMPIWDNKIETIKKKSTQKLVFAFDKFTLNDEKVLNATLREKDGEREINIVITPKQIINAEYIRL